LILRMGYKFLELGKGGIWWYTKVFFKTWTLGLGPLGTSKVFGLDWRVYWKARKAIGGQLEVIWRLINWFWVKGSLFGISLKGFPFKGFPTF